MNEPHDYLERRVIGQRKWHSVKATWNKHRFYTVEILTMLSGALIPVINLWAVKDAYLAGLLSAILGGVVVVSAGVGKLFKFQENWLQFRSVAEALGYEEEYFKAGAGEYAGGEGEHRNKLLVERVENILATTTKQFVSTHRSGPNAGTRA